MQYALAAVITRARKTTGRPVTPVHIAFRQPAPRRHDAFTALFGTHNVDFGAPADSITLNVTDLTFSQSTADPTLAAILRRYAEALPPPSTRATTWTDHVQQILRTLLQTGDASLQAAAQRLSTSPRTSSAASTKPAPPGRTSSTVSATPCSSRSAPPANR